MSTQTIFHVDASVELEVRTPRGAADQTHVHLNGVGKHLTLIFDTPADRMRWETAWGAWRVGQGMSAAPADPDATGDEPVVEVAS